MKQFSETAKSIETIHLKSKLLEMKTRDNIEILIDIQALLKAPAGSDEAYFKITDIAKKFDKQPKIFVNQLPSVRNILNFRTRN